ncbi:hypothetical protein SLS56_008373 [Neofusicoccum ribis]|uniref:MYB transcription factor n=1 Tax=Neofusicoccum ribis TaxID=45134 RepID=A0ABR3SK92_9PEZI
MLRAVKKWTPEEDDLLLQKVALLCAQGKAKDWTAIASAVPGRSNKDCRKRWCNHLVGGLRKGPWDPSEDRRLAIGVKEYGVQWPLVAEEVGTRSADQCAKRWQHSLDPTLDHSKWTEEEEEKLLEVVETHGRAWKQIQTQYFPGRATNNVKNRSANPPNRSSTRALTRPRYVTLTRKRKSPSRDGKSQDASSSVGEIDSGYNSGDRMASQSPARSEETLAPGRDDSGGHSADELYSFDLSTNPAIPSADLNLPTADPFAVDAHFDFANPDYIFNMDSASSSTTCQLVTPDADHRPSSATHSADADPQSVLMDLDFPQSSSAEFVLTIKNPSPDTITAIMGVLVSSKTRFRVELK